MEHFDNKDPDLGKHQAEESGPAIPATNGENPTLGDCPSSTLATMAPVKTCSPTESPGSGVPVTPIEYYGTKRVTAWRHDKEGLGYSECPEHVVVPGYSVQYADGCQSWSPADVFEAAYQPLSALSFGHALAAMRDGQSVTRADWEHGPIYLIEPTPAGGQVIVSFCNGLKSVATLCSNDVLANDWLVIA